MRAFLLLLLPGTAFAWPADDAWLPVKRGQSAPEEPAGDAAFSKLDLVADARPALAWWADGDVLAFRLHLAADPDPGPNFASDTFGVVWTMHADMDEVVDYAITVGGSGGDVSTVRATGAAGYRAAIGPGEISFVGNVNSGAARVVPLDDGTAFVDVQVPLTILVADLGVTAVTEVHWTAVTWSGRFLATIGDIGGCDPAVADCEVVSSVHSDSVQVDGDADVLTLPQERLAFTDPADADTDDDGVIDGLDPGPLTCDTDNDGLVDAIETHTLEVGSGTTLPGCFRIDADLSSLTDPRDADTDGGGLLDGREDADGDGAIGRWETDPLDPSDDLDQDGDGLPDAIEGGADPDGDGVPALIDTDSDHDLLDDVREGRLDPDGDGIPPWLDTDSDDDGIPDGADGTDDVDRDGLPAHFDTDSDGDGIDDGLEGTGDPDEDKRPSHLDTDADGDGKLDADEGLADLDCDGRMDFLDDIPDDAFCDTDLPIGAVDTDAFDAPFDPVDPPETFGPRGGGCDTTRGGRPLWWAAALVVGLIGRRSRGGRIAAVGAAVGGAAALAPVRAEGAEVDVQRLRLATDGWQFFTTEDGALPNQPYGFALAVDHAERPFVLEAGEDDVDVLGAVTTARLMSFVRVGPWVRLGVDMPVHLGLRGEGLREPAAVGDIRLSAKVRLVEAPGDAPVAIAALADLTLPSGAGRLFVGDRLPRATVGVAVRADPARIVSVGAEAALRTGTGEVLSGVKVGPEIAFGGGFSVSPVEPLAISLEVDGAFGLAGAGPPGAPVELLGGARGRVGEGLVISLAGGGGVTQGIGAPSWRVIAGIGFQPGSPTRLHAAPKVRVPPPVVDARPELVVRVIGPAGEYMQQALVDVENVDADGLTGDDGIYRTRLEPGRYLIHVVFPGRAGSHREVVMPSTGTVDVTVVLVEEFQEVLGSPLE